MAMFGARLALADDPEADDLTFNGLWEGGAAGSILQAQTGPFDGQAWPHDIFGRPEAFDFQPAPDQPADSFPIPAGGSDDGVRHAADALTSVIGSEDAGGQGRSGRAGTDFEPTDDTDEVVTELPDPCVCGWSSTQSDYLQSDPAADATAGNEEDALSGSLSAASSSGWLLIN